MMEILLSMPATYFVTGTVFVCPSNMLEIMLSMPITYFYLAYVLMLFFAVLLTKKDSPSQGRGRPL